MLFSFFRGSNPERAKSSIKKLPVASFSAFWFEAGTESFAFGRRKRQMRSICAPDGVPEKSTSLEVLFSVIFVPCGTSDIYLVSYIALRAVVFAYGEFKEQI